MDRYGDYLHGRRLVCALPDASAADLAEPARELDPIISALRAMRLVASEFRPFPDATGWL